MFGTHSSSPAFGSPSGFGTPSTPAFGTPSSTPAFGTPSSTPAFGTPSSTPAFGTPSTPSFATPSTTLAFGSSPAFGTPFSTPAFGASFSTPAFGSPFATPAFGTPSMPWFGTPSTPAFGSSSTPFLQQPQPVQPLQQAQPSFSFFPQQQQQQVPSFTFQPNAQITTQMAPVAPLTLNLTDRDVLAIVDAYKEEPANPKYSFRHLLFSVTDPAARVKPVGVSDIMWAEAMGKLEGMESVDRERLWPELVQGFKGLSNRIKIQDETIVSDAERLQKTQSNVKELQRHIQADVFPWVQRMHQKEQCLQRRLLRVMRIVEALEGRGLRMPLMKGELDLGDKLDSILRQIKGPGGELSRKVHNLSSISRLQANAGGIGASYHIGSVKIDERSLADLQVVLQLQTEAIARLGNVLKKDTRDMEIITSEAGDKLEDGGRRALKSF
ncbi:nuclear pore complex protein NUP54 isoform X2 [Dendrobium catenatum]|uniref:nuclear pore complex protein NUP54 isoform X2 n=1 Tax=Dendrobium catenatum TaxID=906689 RepID=UPI0009F66C15|nr:nuclear pore complex protein NUP54 isoform X2 [Dendrobium catenatum]